jgi:hypothetical protein
MSPFSAWQWSSAARHKKLAFGARFERFLHLFIVESSIVLFISAWQSAPESFGDRNLVKERGEECV